ALLDALERARPRALLALCTRMQRPAALSALAAAGLDPARFFHIDTAPGETSGATSTPPSPPAGGPIERIVAAAPAVASAGSPGVRVFFVCARPEDVDAAALAQTVLGDAAAVIPVALRSPHVSDQALDRPGFALLVDDLDQAAALVTTPVLPCSLGIVLLAYDEEASIADAIADARRFASLYFAGHEIVVVDDGSRDATAARARACDQGDVRLVQHAVNQGMGASMRDGYAAARTDLLVPLPGDRQVRPASLIGCAAQLANHGPADPMHVVLSGYSVPHSGPARQVMSVAFRLLVRHVGGYRVDCAGVYVFHRSLLDRIDPRRTRSQTFLYSFQLLEQMRRLGCRFTQVIFAPFAREVGQSREATLRRIARMFVEIARARLESGL
ncbi:MAG TPA: glycosyltransferase, partial [Haliangium sp.]|nr:glycosyltransferase [Haliangium sp.]